MTPNADGMGNNMTEKHNDPANLGRMAHLFGDLMPQDEYDPDLIEGTAAGFAMVVAAFVVGIIVGITAVKAWANIALLAV